MNDVTNFEVRHHHDLRALASGQMCMIRSPACNHNPETTVLCHYRQIGISGAGLKSPDILAAWGCSACHDLVDFRTHIEGFDRPMVMLMHLQGVARTLAELVRRELVFW